ncbi:unnamed protein product, partial [Brassica rapa subsp. narinosa]
ITRKLNRSGPLLIEGFLKFEIEEMMKMQLDRKTRSLTSSWRNVRGGTNEKEEGKD